jgi:hypothetical protein
VAIRFTVVRHSRRSPFFAGAINLPNINSPIINLIWR